MQRIALCLDLIEIFERYKARVQLIIGDSKEFTLTIRPSTGLFPELTIRNKIEAFALASNIVLHLSMQERSKEIVTKGW